MITDQQKRTLQKKRERALELLLINEIVLSDDTPHPEVIKTGYKAAGFRKKPKSGGFHTIQAQYAKIIQTLEGSPQRPDKIREVVLDMISEGVLQAGPRFFEGETK